MAYSVKVDTYNINDSVMSTEAQRVFTTKPNMQTALILAQNAYNKFWRDEIKDGMKLEYEITEVATDVFKLDVKAIDVDGCTTTTSEMLYVEEVVTE